MTGYYEYLTLHHPSDTVMNAYAKKGYRVVAAFHSRPGGGELGLTVLMERVAKDERTD